MALLTSIFEYLCTCGEYLFKYSNIVTSNMLNETNYLFVPENCVNDHGSLKIEKIGSSNARCTKCKNFLGGFVFYDEQTEIRFVRHRIVRRTKTLYLYNVINDRGIILKNDYEIQATCSKSISIPIGTLQRE